uniref:DNA helicase n=1 Tax=Pandoraea faecigallinarum TaxID=656179 RepID=A0A0H3WN92_9BURK
MPDKGIDIKTKTVLADYGAYFAEHPTATKIDTAAFQTFFALRHPKLNEEQLALYGATLREAAEPAPPGSTDGIRNRLAEVATSNRLAALIDGYEAGEVDLTAALRAVAERHESIVQRTVEHPKVKDRIEDILLAEANDTGFHYGIACIDASMKPLRSGDFGIIAARVDSGKTSLIACLLAAFAPQVEQLFPGQGRTIIVLNNEGPGRKIKQRFYNAMLKATTSELVRWSQDGSIYERYVQAQGGRDLFYVFDVHDFTVSQLEDIVRDVKPAVVVVDMLDNVSMDQGAANGGTRTDQLLEAMYQRARIWAVKYDCAVLATSQLNGTAEGECFPKQNMLANSQTGKAGAADFILMLGRSSDPTLQNTRFLSLPKNKKRRDGAAGDPRREVYFDAGKSQFNDPE